MPAPLDRILHPVDISPFQQISPPHVEDPPMTPVAPSFTSYKRVPKACTQCRRDKTRCDKARPCNGCVKRGRADSCLDGCVACRRARLRCDGNRPCYTCAEQGRECVEDDPAAIAAARSRQMERQKPIAVFTSFSTISLPPPLSPASDSPPPSSASTLSTDVTSTPQSRTRSKPYSSENRVKLACLACKRDNKKCAGGRPCPHCVQGGTQCVYVSRAPKLVKQRCALCRKKNKKCEEARPCLHCVKAGVECIDLPRKGTGPGLRVKRACAGCRSDKIQCEEVRPCAGCKRKKIPCVARECKACVEKGTQCSACVRQSRFLLERSPSEESDSDSESLSTPSLRSSCSSALASDPHVSDNSLPPIMPPKQHDSPMHNPYMYAPLPGPSFHSSGFPSGPSMHPMRPCPLLCTPEHTHFYSESPRSLTLGASMSDVRTRSAHVADE